MRDADPIESGGNRMIRRLLAAVSVLSLLLFVATILLWATSWSYPASVVFTYHHEQCRVWTSSGRAGMDNQPEVAIQTEKRARDLGAMESIGGVDLMVPPPSHVPSSWSRSSLMLLPSLAVLGAAVVVMPWIIGRMRRRDRAKNFQCPACGYNLFGNTSGVCPECGTPTQSKAEEAA